MKYNRFELKRVFGNVMLEGAINEAHDDDGDRYPGKPAVEEHYSAVLMLNNDYEGGELYFEHHGVQVRLEAGDLIMFRGNAENLHGVRQVTSGKRVNAIIFFRNHPTDSEYDNHYGYNIWKDFIDVYKK
jgi:predicted 2-oxoglutarate/Fe(II)-dependent dioxygenase YbiX